MSTHLNITNPYLLLGIPSNADKEAIRRAFQQITNRLTMADQAGQLGAMVQLQEVSQAFDTLNDAEKRRQIDRELGRISADTKEFAFDVTPILSKRIIEPLLEPQVVYMMLTVKPNKRALQKQAVRDAGINLTLVLDHSNSMSGTRLEKVKVAVAEIIEQLNENDYISIVGFNDRAETFIKAQSAENKSRLIARTKMMRASGGTEIFQGLKKGFEENKKNADPNRVNHIILLTDGNTYGDQESCMELAREATDVGIGISALGLGHEWNDKFLDELASATGGSSAFIRSPKAVSSFMTDQVAGLSNVFAERVQISIAVEPDVDVEMVFKLTPSPQPLPTNEGYVQLGGMQLNRPISVLMQLQLPPNIKSSYKPLARVVTRGDILVTQYSHLDITDIQVEIQNNPPTEEPPKKILDALGKITLYRMQERADDAIEDGNVEEATRRLKRLATRLLDVGEDSLAREVMSEMQNIEKTSKISEEGRKSMKYQTRALVSPES